MGLIHLQGRKCYIREASGKDQQAAFSIQQYIGQVNNIVAETGLYSGVLTYRF
jgi:hypothetical protein